jgi:hypothetical protein
MKMQISNLVCRTSFIRYSQNQKIGKPNNLKVFRSKKPKETTRYPKSPKVAYLFLKIIVIKIRLSKYILLKLFPQPIKWYATI